MAADDQDGMGLEGGGGGVGGRGKGEFSLVGFGV